MELLANNVLQSVKYAMDQLIHNVQVANNHIILMERHAQV